MKRKLLGILLLLSILVGGPVFAASYGYYIPITITEIGGTSREGVPILLDFSNDNLVSTGHLSSSGLDTRYQEGGVDAPYSVIDSKLGIMVPSLAQYQEKEFRYYTEYDPVATAYDILTGSGGKITVSDDTDLELGDDFEIEVGDAYIDTDTVFGGIRNLESNLDASSSTSEVFGVEWFAQSFSYPNSFQITAIKIKVEKEGAPTGTFTVGIKISTNGRPLGGYLTSGTFDSSTIGGSAEWKEVDVTDYVLDGSTTYSIVCSLVGGDISNNIHWYDSSGDPYSSGSRWYSSDSGNNWNESLTRDFGFEVWGRDYLYLVYKQSAFNTYISSSNEITSGIPQQTVYMIPDAVGDYTNIASVAGAATHWEAVDDPVATPDDDATRVYTSNTAQEKDAYNLSLPSISDTIDSVTVYFRFSGTSGGGLPHTASLQPGLRLNSDEVMGTKIQVPGSSYGTYSEVLSRPGGGDWIFSDFADLQVVIGLEADNSAGKCTQVYVEVKYTVEVTATGISSGEHTIWTRGVSPVFGNDLIELLIDVENLVWNSNFEVGDPPCGWDISGSGSSYERSDVQKKIDNYSLYMVRNGADTKAEQTISNYSDYAGKEVTLGAWLWSLGAASDAGCIRLYDGVSTETSEFHPGDSTWHWYTVTLTVDTSPSYLKLNMLVINTNAGVYFDGAILVEGDTVPVTPPCPTTIWWEYVSVPDNGNNWIIMDNSTTQFMPYMGLYKHTVDGTLIAEYNPDFIISGTTLVDEVGGNENGAITWGPGRLADAGTTTTLDDSELTQDDDYWIGYVIKIKETTDHLAPEGEESDITDFDAANDRLTFDALTVAPEAGDRYEIWTGQKILWGNFPEDLNVEVGPITSYISPVSSAADVGEPSVAYTPTTPDALWGGAAPTDLPLYTLFNTVAIDLGWTAQTLYVVMAVAVAMGMGVGVLLITGSSLGAIAMVGTGMFVGTSMSILPLWMIIVYAVLSGSWIYLAGRI